MKQLTVKAINYTLIAAGMAFLGYALYIALFGIGESSGILGLIGSFSGTLALSVPVTGVTVKGPFSIIEERTKKDKPALLILFEKSAKGIEAMEKIDLLCRVSALAFFSWPTKNTDKDKYVAKGMMNNEISRELLNTYLKGTVATAIELGEKAKVARQAEKDQKKAAKVANKGTGTATLAKLAALKDIFEAGHISAEKYAELVANAGN